MTLLDNIKSEDNKSSFSAPKDHKRSSLTAKQVRKIDELIARINAILSK